MVRVLVVEDDPLQAEHLRLILAAEGFEVRVASSGEQALELAQATDFGLVVTDVLMPGISGYELCRTLKDDPARRHTPVILLTSLSHPEDIVRGIESGADHFIPKPYQRADLAGRIRALLANRALRARGKPDTGIEVVFLGKRLTITSGKEQILDLLLSTCEEIVRTNQKLRATHEELRAAQARIERHNGQLQSQARSSEDRYRALMEQANDAILLLDPFGQVLEANRRAAQLLGLPHGDVAGRFYTDFVPAGDRERERREMHRLWASQLGRSEHIHFQRANGELLSVRLSASVVDLGSEQVVLALAHDATEQDRLERQLHQSQKMEAVGRLAGGVAHDFNNLLTVITGYADVLLGSLGPGDAVGEMVAEIKQAGDRAASLTRQLLAFSRQQVITPRVLDLNAVVTDTVRLLRRLIGEDIELSTALEPALGQVKADPGLLEQVLMNLAVNSRDAMPQGGKLTIATANAELAEGEAGRPGLRPGRYVALTVADTGRGMDATTQAHLFEPFFTTKEKGKGTGLGLAVVYGAVKQMGGFVYADSAPGLGSTFRVYLPRVEAAVTWGKAAEGPAGLALGTETVLLVEDEEAVRRLTRIALQMNGYRTLEAANGVEALGLLERHQGPLHLLVTDVVMPEMGGRQLADRLTSQHPGLKVLYVSGYTDDSIVRHGVEEAEVAFLQKPFALSALVRKVREVLDHEGRSPQGGSLTGPGGEEGIVVRPASRAGA